MPTLRLRAAERVFGRHTPTVRHFWWRIRARSPWEKNRAMRVAKSFVRANGLSVRRGPFAGMRYPREAVAATTVVPKLLGSFELELHPVLDEVLDRGCSTILNIGSAEGYYAVGLA